MQYEVASTAALWGIFDLFYLVALHWCIRLDFDYRVYTSQEEVIFNDINLHIPTRRLDPLRGRCPPHTVVSSSHGWDVPPQILKMSRPLTRETSTHYCGIPLRRESPLIKHSSKERNPLLRRSSTETSHLTRMSPFRHLFTEMCYYKRCSDLLRKSLPHEPSTGVKWRLLLLLLLKKKVVVLFGTLKV